MRRLTVVVAGTLVAGVLLTPLRAQPQRGPRLTDFRVVPENVSPNEIFRRITELRLPRDHFPQKQDPIDGLDRYVSTIWRELELPDGWDGRCPACDALLLDELSPTVFVVFRIRMDAQQYRFIVFVPPGRLGTRWRLAGYADTSAHYNTPVHRLENTPAGTFLAVGEDTGGTGVYEQNESWHELRPDSSVAALVIPVKGNDEIHVGQVDGRYSILEHTWSSTISHHPDNRDPFLRVTLTSHYAIEDAVRLSDLFSKTETAAYSWQEASRKYVFDERASSLSREELATYREDGTSLPQFFRYNEKPLEDVATEGTAAQKVLLRNLLGDPSVASLPEATDLLRRLK